MPGYVGDGRTKCTIGMYYCCKLLFNYYLDIKTEITLFTVQAESTPECTADADCPSKLACFNNVCKNPCIETKPCGPHAICSVVDSLPLRTMVCSCEPGYVGNADIGCKLGIKYFN